MKWPLSQDYNEAIQNPATSFADPLLRQGTPVTNNLGIPVPRSGNFADVYPFRDGRGRLWALKCFTRPVSGLQERYAAIDRHLTQANLPFVVGFRFHPQGIRVHGKWFPLLQMDWVEGLTLDEFVRKFGGSPANLESLFLMWVRLCRRLRQTDIAHGDLQHGNVLLVPSGQGTRLGLKLIDYDGMWVPELARRVPGEIGHPHYQHPTRAKGLYGPDIDRFPHLVIACALRALVVGGIELWHRHDTGDHLLLSRRDFIEPERSALVAELWKYDDPILTPLLGHLLLSARRSMSETPWLDHLMVNAETLALTDSEAKEVTSMIGLEPRPEITKPHDLENVFAALRFDDSIGPATAGVGSNIGIWLIGLAFFALGFVLLLAPVVMIFMRFWPASQ